MFEKQGGTLYIPFEGIWLDIQAQNSKNKTKPSVVKTQNFIWWGGGTPQRKKITLEGVGGTPHIPS